MSGPGGVATAALVRGVWPGPGGVVVAGLNTLHLLEMYNLLYMYNVENAFSYLATFPALNQLSVWLLAHRHPRLTLHRVTRTVTGAGCITYCISWGKNHHSEPNVQNIH